MPIRRFPILLFTILVVSSCDNDKLPQVVNPPAPTTEELIIADAYVVRDALEAFAAENGGRYPSHPTELSDTGKRLVAYLPSGVSLTNRYTGLATVPVLYDAQWPGEIGVIPFDDQRGYRVMARGRYGELVRIENLSVVDPRAVTAIDSVLANCDSTVAAAEEFRRLSGSYPGDVGADPLPNGDTMTDLLPGGWLLKNPYWGGNDSPVDGSAAAAGQVGYSPWDRDNDGYRDGYTVDALGDDGVTLVAMRTRESPESDFARTSALRLRKQAEGFAAQNGGEYPRDLDTDETPSGQTLRELAGNQINPYTGTSPYRDGLATSRGEVGYVPLEYNGVVVGYIINALGLFNEELEHIEVLH